MRVPGHVLFNTILQGFDVDNIENPLDLPIEKEVSTYLESFDKSATGESILAVTLRILENDSIIKGLYRYNQFSKEIEHTGPVYWSLHIKEGSPLGDNDFIELASLLAKKYDFSPPMQRIEQAVRSIALRKSYNPVANYLTSLRWDGEPRLDLWLHRICGADDNIYTSAVGRKFLVAAVTRVFDPGCKFDYMTILEGKQGIKKTTLVEVLAGKEYSTAISFTMSNKEIVDIMRGKWLIEIKEMHGFSKSDVERVKAMIDQHTDRVRVSYGRKAEDHPRNNIFIGTMNPLGENKYLADETGNRRFWPIECKGDIDINTLYTIRDQLWAEAVHLYKNKEPLYLETKDVEKIAENHQEERTLHSDPWDNLIAAYLKEKENQLTQELTATQIMAECLKILPEKMNRGYAGRVGRSVKKYGWILKQRTTRHDRTYYYISPNIEESWKE